MSRVNQYSKPSWVDNRSLCDCSRCITCDCRNIPWLDSIEVERSWGIQTDVSGNKYLVFGSFIPMPLAFWVALFPCFFIHFAFMSCIPFAQAIVLHRTINGNVSVALKNKSCCSGQDTAARDDIVSVNYTVEEKSQLLGMVKRKVYTIQFVSATGDHLEHVMNEDKPISEKDVTSFINECQMFINPEIREALMSAPSFPKPPAGWIDPAVPEGAKPGDIVYHAQQQQMQQQQMQQQQQILQMQMQQMQMQQMQMQQQDTYPPNMNPNMNMNTPPLVVGTAPNVYLNMEPNMNINATPVSGFPGPEAAVYAEAVPYVENTCETQIPSNFEKIER
jgi:hypothetical protein